MQTMPKIKQQYMKLNSVVKFHAKSTEYSNPCLTKTQSFCLGTNQFEFRFKFKFNEIQGHACITCRRVTADVQEEHGMGRLMVVV